MKNPIIITAAVGLFVSACATTTGRESADRQRAECERMEQAMGLNSPHDHAEMKGRGLNPMNLTHERCVALMNRQE